AAPQRVKVYSIGRTEEGREMIAVAIASDQIMAKLEENRERLAKLGDPRTINMDDAQAETLVQQSTPIYYITGTIHSPETGAPTGIRRCCTTCTSRCRISTTTPWATDRTTRGSIRSSPTSGR